MKRVFLTLIFSVSCLPSISQAASVAGAAPIRFHCGGDNIQIFGDIRGSFVEDLNNPGTGTIRFGGWIDDIGPFNRSGNAQVRSDGTIAYLDNGKADGLTLSTSFVDQIVHPNDNSQMIAAYTGRRYAQIYELNCRFEASTEPDEPYRRGMGGMGH